MGNAKKKDVILELLVSTMNRNSLDFLEELIPFGDYKNYDILIINQTDQANQLDSNFDNIRVINSLEKGLAKSRNTAISKAIGDICLILDDDIKLKPDFESIIVEGYQNNINAAIITFMMEDFEGKLFKDYPKVKLHNLQSIKEVNSVVISFKLEAITNRNLLFDTNFGLGSIFETADEYIFMREALKLGLVTLFEPKVLLSHSKISSGQDNGSDRLVFARSALYYKYSGNLGYLKLCKYLYLINKEGNIKANQIFDKFKVGLKGIMTYKTILKSGLDN